MAKFAFVAFVALVALQGCFAKPKGKQQEKSPLEELAANTENLVNNVTQALGIKELPDSKEVVEVLNTQTQTLANHVQEIVDKLKNEVKAHQGEVDNVIKQVQQKLSETATQLQQIAGPEATAKAKELKSSLDSGLKTAVAQVEKLVKAIEPDATKAKADIQKAAETLLHQISDVSNTLETQVKATVAEHEKTHKH
ncbi:sgm1 [Asbolus verrucosus]|uniref:Sgm1 n=1 Tax=Asbolus verrucosus TaxID=1661398 RepID=A0A482VCK2_ASBVE|nr:sgm1 [Asbolus verrucosus]